MVSKSCYFKCIKSTEALTAPWSCRQTWSYILICTTIRAAGVVALRSGPVPVVQHCRFAPQRLAALPTGSVMATGSMHMRCIMPRRVQRRRCVAVYTAKCHVAD